MNAKSVSSSNRTLVGKCLCGAVQVSIPDEFLYAGYCHCPDCRASSGSAFSAFAGIRKIGVALISRVDRAWRHNGYTFALGPKFELLETKVVIGNPDHEPCQTRP